MTLQDAKREGSRLTDQEHQLIRMGYGWLTAGEHSGTALTNLIADVVKNRKTKGD